MPLGEYTLLVVVLAALGALVLRSADPVPPETRVVVRRPVGHDVAPTLGQGRGTALPLPSRERGLALPSNTGGLGIGAIGRGEARLAGGPRRRMESTPALPGPGSVVPARAYAPVGMAPALAPVPVAPLALERPAAAIPGAGKLIAFTVVVPMEQLDGRRARLSLTLE